MKIPVILAPFPVALSIEDNLQAMRDGLECTQPGDWIVLPESALSGYADDPTFLLRLHQDELADGNVMAEVVSATAMVKRIGIDLDSVSDYYLGQCRRDVVDLTSGTHGAL